MAAPSIAPPEGLALIAANEDDIVYELTFDLPDAGLQLPGAQDGVAVVPQDVPVVALNPDQPKDETPKCCYPLCSPRSAGGHQPYNDYAPQMTFLQLGDARAHRSDIKASKLVTIAKEEWLMATTMSIVLGSDMINDAMHISNPELVLSSEEEVKIWGYLMTQYNHKAGLWKFVDRGKTVAMEDLTQLHNMDMLKAMDPAKLSWEERMRALSTIGVVHANVGQKLLFCDKIKSFLGDR